MEGEALGHSVLTDDLAPEAAGRVRNSIGIYAEESALIQGLRNGGTSSSSLSGSLHTTKIG